MPPPSPAVLPSFLISHLKPDTTTSTYLERVKIHYHIHVYTHLSVHHVSYAQELTNNIHLILSLLWKRFQHTNVNFTGASQYMHHSQPDDNTRTLAVWSHLPAKWCPTPTAATVPVYSSLQPHYFTPACNRTILLQLATPLYCTCHSSQKPNTSIQACTYLCIHIKTQTCEFLQRDLHPVQCLTAMHTDDTDLPMHRQLVCRHAQSSCYFTRAVIWSLGGHLDRTTWWWVWCHIKIQYIWFQTLITKPYKHTLHIMLTSSNGLPGM